MKPINTKPEFEIPKYLKSTKSNISKCNRKSKHKHQYKECLIQYYFNFNKKHRNTCLCSYCTICGKIGDRFKENKSVVKDFTKVIDTPVGRCYSVISDEKLYEKYYDKLPVFFIEDIWKDKYVDFEQNNNRITI